MITVEKCPCGNEHCTYYHLKGVGTFTRGTGFTRDQADLIANFLNYNQSSDWEMMMVQQFHRKFGLPCDGDDILSDDSDVLNFRAEFMREEISEFISGFLDKDRVEMFDALLDLVYVAKGTALFMGITPAQWDLGMQAVQDANMSKVKPSEENPGKRNSPWDVVKPDGWQSPEPRLKEILS